MLMWRPTDFFASDLSTCHLAYHYFVLLSIITSIILMGISIYCLYLLQTKTASFVNDDEIVGDIEIQLFNNIKVSEKVLFGIAILLGVGSFVIFQCVGIPGIHHFIEVDEHLWIRANSGMSVLHITTFASFITLFIACRDKFDKTRIEFSVNKETIYKLMNYQKIAWLINGLIIIDITSVYVFWMSV